MAYNKRQKLQDNIAAIRTVFQLKKEGRAATDAEREVLKRYSGFGGLKFVLNNVDVDNIDNRDIEFWNKSDRKYYDQTKELFDTIREGASTGLLYLLLTIQMRKGIVLSVLSMMECALSLLAL